ncbi:MAG: protein-L-isoaspartate(D-aspartate) O-methyltransferase [Thermoanaerobaculia bacterium]|nr:protein-L-isoaspartate(D-aspartate) O-methyltransferase [Thermoanaerobaculia bacterium]
MVTMACNTNADSSSRRTAMVADQIAARGVADARVLDVMRRVPRERFIPKEMAGAAYDDSPLPIGNDQTISQPYIVAYMTEQLHVTAQAKVLEIGTGSGYQAAILGELAREVYTIEILPELAQRAAATLKALGYKNIHVRAGDGYRGWPEEAPFDRIIVTAAPDHVPQPLIDQLAIGGRLVIPVGDYYQQMTIIEKTREGVVERKTLDVRFVPMTGEAQKR